MIEQPRILPLAEPWWRPAYRLLHDYTYKGITVPAGFEFDGSSEWLVSWVLPWVPAWALWLFRIRADGPHRAAALVHDWLYKHRIGTRAEADKIFYDLCVAGGLPKWLAWVRWAVLWATGWIAWNL